MLDLGLGSGPRKHLNCSRVLSLSASNAHASGTSRGTRSQIPLTMHKRSSGIEKLWSRADEKWKRNNRTQWHLSFPFLHQSWLENLTLTYFCMVIRRGSQLQGEREGERGRRTERERRVHCSPGSLYSCAHLPSKIFTRNELLLRSAEIPQVLGLTTVSHSTKNQDPNLSPVELPIESFSLLGF